jgi:hypothetical protein
VNKYVEQRESRVILETLKKSNRQVSQDEVFGLVEHAKNDVGGTLCRIDLALINLSKVRNELLRSRDEYVRRLVFRAVKDKVN